MTDVHDDFWSHVLRRATECVSTIPWLDLLHEAEVSQFDVTIVLEEDILRLEISVDQVHRMDVFEHNYDLCSIEPGQYIVQLLVSLQQIEQLPELQEIFEHVEIILILINSLQIADQRVVHLSHVLHLIVDVLLLLSFKHFVFGNYLQCIHLLLILTFRSEGHCVEHLWRSCSLL